MKKILVFFTLNLVFATNSMQKPNTSIALVNKKQQAKEATLREKKINEKEAYIKKLDTWIVEAQEKIDNLSYEKMAKILRKLRPNITDKDIQEVFEEEEEDLKKDLFSIKKDRVKQDEKLSRLKGFLSPKKQYLFGLEITPDIEEESLPEEWEIKLKEKEYKRAKGKEALQEAQDKREQIAQEKREKAKLKMKQHEQQHAKYEQQRQNLMTQYELERKEHLSHIKEKK